MPAAGGRVLNCRQNALNFGVGDKGEQHAISCSGAVKCFKACADNRMPDEIREWRSGLQAPPKTPTENRFTDFISPAAPQAGRRPYFRIPGHISCSETRPCSSDPACPGNNELSCFTNRILDRLLREKSLNHLYLGRHKTRNIAIVLHYFPDHGAVYGRVFRIGEYEHRFQLRHKRLVHVRNGALIFEIPPVP